MNGIVSRVTQLRAQISRAYIGRAGVIFAGSAAGQIAAALALPFMTRIYGPAVLGRTGALLAIVSIGQLLVFLQYDQAVVVATDEELPLLMALNLSLATLWFVGLSLVILAGAAWPVSSLSGVLAHWGIDWMLPVLLFSYSLFVLFVNLALRHNRLAQVSTGRVIYYAGGAGLQIVFGLLLGGNANAFLLAQVVASAVAVLYLLPLKEVRGWAQVRQAATAPTVAMRDVARRYVQFPKYQTGANLINSLSIYLPLLVLRAAFSEAWAGWYFVAWRLLAGPATLVGQAFGQVFYRDSAELERQGLDQARILERTVAIILGLVLVPAVAVGLVFPALADVLFGPDWAPVARIFQVLLPMVIVSFAVSPISPLLLVKDLQRQDLYYKTGLFLFRAAALGAGVWLGSAMIALAGYSLISVVILLLYMNFIFHSAGGNILRVLGRVSPLLAASGALILLALLLSSLGMLDKISGLAVMAVAFAVALILAYYKLRRSFSLAALATPIAQ